MKIDEIKIAVETSKKEIHHMHLEFMECQKIWELLLELRKFPAVSFESALVRKNAEAHSLTTLKVLAKRVEV